MFDERIGRASKAAGRLGDGGRLCGCGLRCRGGGFALFQCGGRPFKFGGGLPGAGFQIAGGGGRCGGGPLGPQGFERLSYGGAAAQAWGFGGAAFLERAGGFGVCGERGEGFVNVGNVHGSSFESSRVKISVAASIAARAGARQDARCRATSSGFWVSTPPRFQRKTVRGATRHCRAMAAIGVFGNGSRNGMLTLGPKCQISLATRPGNARVSACSIY